MEGILTTFGIDARLIVIQIINFGILAVALWYFLYTPILNMLREREEKIKKGIEDAESAVAALSEADKAKQEILSAAHKGADEVAQKAKVYAEEKADGIVSAAEEKANSVVQQAEQKSEDIKAQAQKDSEAEVAKVAVLAAEKILRQQTS